MTAPACVAPSTSLHLDPSGHVRVCELNSMAMLGTIPEDRLPDLWHGERIRRVRAALARHDLSLGCEGCAAQLRAGARELAHASYYDRFAAVEAEPEWPRQLELSLSNTCNLQCAMCNGDYSSAIRAQRERRPPLPKVYDEVFFADLATFLPHLEHVTFIGGEPFIGAESLRVMDMLVAGGSTATCGVTTNGTVLTRRVERLVTALPMDVSVSLDAATAATYESIRRGGSFVETMANVDRLVEIADRVSLSFCLMVQNWQELVPFLRMAEERGLHGHVNVVTAPRRFSLYHLPATELSRVVESLDEQAGAVGTLPRNLVVLDQQRARLRAHLDALEGAPVAVRGATGGQREAAVSAAEVARSWSDDGRVHVVEMGTSEEIVAIRPDPADVMGLDLRGHLQGHLTSLVGALTSGFGELVETDLRYLAGGVEDRLLVFARDGRRTEVRAVLGDGDPGDEPAVTSRWHLALRRAG